jgi:hypothetical protein
MRGALIGTGILLVIIVAISVATGHNSPSGNTAATTTSSEGMRLVPVWPVVFANHS